MDVLGTLVFLIVAAMFLYFGHRMFQFGGFKAAMFNAHIEHTVGEVPGEAQGPTSVVLKVHALRRESPERLVGVELVAKTIGSYEMMPVVLSVQQAEQLAVSSRMRHVRTKPHSAAAVRTHSARPVPR